MPSATAYSAPECSPHNPGRNSPHLLLAVFVLNVFQLLSGFSALRGSRCTAKSRPGSVLSRAGKRLNICVPVRCRTVPPHSIQLKWLYIFHRKVVTLAKNRRFPSRFGSATRMSNINALGRSSKHHRFRRLKLCLPDMDGLDVVNEDHSLFRSFLTDCKRDLVRSIAT
jgi:hypothetical protein